MGLVRGGSSSKGRAQLQPGNRVKLTWRARLAENLGIYVAELSRARASDMFEDRAALDKLLAEAKAKVARWNAEAAVRSAPASPAAAAR